MSRDQLYHFPSVCEKIISCPDFTLENLLDEDEIVIDVKEGKENIIEFFLRPEIVKALVSYLVDIPTKNTSDAVQYRYPAVAFEILTSEIDEMNDVLLDDSSLLDMILGYFERIHLPTVSRRISLVSRLVLYLFRLASNKMTKFITKRENLVPFLIANISIAGYVTFITSLIQEEEYIVSWLIGAKFIPKVIENFSPVDPSKHSHTCTTILEILEVVNSKSRFVFELNSKPILDQLSLHMFAPDNRSALLKGLTILLRLLQMKNSERQVYGVKKELPAIGHLILDKLPELCKILREPLVKNEKGEEPFGALRLTILRVIKGLVEGNYPVVQEKVLNSNLYDFLAKSFSSFPKNNLFHAAAAHLICLCFQQRNASEIIIFLSTTKLIEYMIALEHNPDSFRYKHWFHLCCRVLIDRAKRYMEVQEYVEKKLGWLDYSSMVIAEKIKEDQFDRDRLKEEGESSVRPETVGWKDDDVGIELDHTKLTEDVDIDSKTDTEECELNDTEMSISKFEIENFEAFVL